MHGGPPPGGPRWAAYRRRAVLAILVRCGRRRRAAPDEPGRPPNVVLVLTDDQGYGDLGALGNTMIRTPNMDRLHAESVRLTDFHVDPDLLTHPLGPDDRPVLDPHRRLAHDRRPLADAGRRADVGRGAVGRRLSHGHVRQVAPRRQPPAATRATRGFRTLSSTVAAASARRPTSGATITSTTPTSATEPPTSFRGYCTDIWFDNALRFIETNRDRPFFAYIATNAPHGPYNVDESYARPYLDAGVPQPMANFYGMITNIDENLGRLVTKLDELGLADDTILVFMTDNGTAAGVARNPEPGQWPAASMPACGGRRALHTMAGTASRASSATRPAVSVAGATWTSSDGPRRHLADDPRTLRGREAGWPADRRQQPRPAPHGRAGGWHRAYPVRPLAADRDPRKVAAVCRHDRTLAAGQRPGTVRHPGRSRPGSATSPDEHQRGRGGPARGLREMVDKPLRPVRRVRAHHHWSGRRTDADHLPRLAPDRGGCPLEPGDDPPPAGLQRVLGAGGGPSRPLSVHVAARTRFGRLSDRGGSGRDPGTWDRPLRP